MCNIVAIVTLIKTDLLAFYNTSYTITQVNRRDNNAYNSGKILDNDSYQKYTLNIFLDVHLSFIAEKLHKIKKFFEKILIHKTDNPKIY